MCTRKESDVWAWRPESHRWYEWLLGRVKLLQLDARLQLDRKQINVALTRAIETREPWLMHPAVSVLTDEEVTEDSRLARQFVLAAWVAAHTDTDLGEIHISHPLWAWASNGGVLVPSGRHAFWQIGSTISEAEKLVAIDLDLWSHSAPSTGPLSWSVTEDLSVKAQQQLSKDVTSYLRVIALLEREFAEIASWSSSVTKVVIPFRTKEGATVRRSASQADLPGVIRMDLSFGELAILEALVHESAHRHLYLYELDNPLVQARYDGRLFNSPLRKEPRPLRGVMLAFHALAYLCAAFHELQLREAINPASILDKELTEFRRCAAEAQTTLEGGRSCLTEAGEYFIERTRRVAAYAGV